jgi:hypothetical protein
MLDLLAGIGASRTKSLLGAVTGIRSPSAADTTLAVITAPPTGAEVAALSRAGTAFGRKLVVLVYPMPLASLQPQAAAELDARATTARASLQRAGWEVVLLQPEGKLADTWRRTKTQKLQVAGSRS